MPLTDTELKKIHEIVRFELRRERDGICCPECGAEMMSAEEYDREWAGGEGRVSADVMFSCGRCCHEAPLRGYRNAVLEHE